MSSYRYVVSVRETIDVQYEIVSPSELTDETRKQVLDAPGNGAFLYFARRIDLTSCLRDREIVAIDEIPAKTEATP